MTVVGVGLVGTSSGKLGEVNYGLPVAGVNAIRRVLPGVLKVLGQRAELVEKGRRATADLFAGIIKRYSFASRRRSGGRPVRRADDRGHAHRRGRRVLPGVPGHDKTAALAHFARLPVLVLAGDQGPGDAERAQRRRSRRRCRTPSSSLYRTPGTW